MRCVVVAFRTRTLHRFYTLYVVGYGLAALFCRARLFLSLERFDALAIIIRTGVTVCMFDGKTISAYGIGLYRLPIIALLAPAKDTRVKQVCWHADIIYYFVYVRF